MKYQLLSTFGLWAACLIVHVLAAPLWIPSTTLEAYKNAKCETDCRIARVLWYSIGFIWFVNPQTPKWSQRLLGVAIFAAGSALLIWAMRSNPYFRPSIETPEQIIADGAYRHMRHPGYLGMVAMGFGTMTMLGSVLSVVPLLIYIELIRQRVMEENRQLYGD